MLSVVLGIFLFSVLISTIFGMLMLIGSSVYDIAQIQQEKKPARGVRTAKRRYRPLVSIVIPAFNEELSIERCLSNLKKLRYKNIEFIVADDKSKDNTRAIVRRYITEHPEQNIRLVCKRKNGGRGAAINLGAKHATGEIITAFDADCVFERNAMLKLVAHFADPSVGAVAANVRIMDDGTVLGMLQRLEYLISFRSKKFNTITESEYIIGGAGASYRASVLRANKGFDEAMKTEDIEFSMRLAKNNGRQVRLIYASDYLVHTEPVPTYRGLFRQRYRWKFGSLQALFKNRSLVLSRQEGQNYFMGWVRLPMALWSEFMLLLEPILFTLFVYVALVNKNPMLFISACIAYAVVAWLAIWSDEHYSLETKLKLSMLAPFMYIASFVLSLVQVTAAFRSIASWKSLTGRVSVSGAYTSTQRFKQGLEVAS
jgi:cellulose synthase/poly-beta-1,6-N-acetylglucosamine synthase-like glycosyltransferase